MRTQCKYEAYSERKYRYPTKKLKFIFKICYFYQIRHTSKLLFYIVSTIIKVFITTGHQFLYPFFVERGRL